MTHEEKIAAWQKSGELKVTGNKVTGPKIPMLSVGIKQPSPGDLIPPKLDLNGQPALELFPRNQKREMETLGWEEYKITAPPAGAKKAPVKKS